MKPAIYINVEGIHAVVARNFLERARGLIARPPPPAGTGLLIPKCNAVHTFFMRYSIDVIFLDRDLRPVKIVRAVRPWRIFIWGGWKARSALEIAAE